VTELRGVIRTGPAGAPLAVLLGGADSDGQLGVVEMEMAAGSGGPPLHVHPTHGEGFYVLVGKVTFRVGDAVIEAGPGSWLFAPRNTPHTLANLSDDAARVLCGFAPGGFERRFQRAIARQLGEPLPPELEELSAAERETRLIGPPLGPLQPGG
jgi:quercetin dioxygenase-like cupin family protein